MAVDAVEVLTGVAGGAPRVAGETVGVPDDDGDDTDFEWGVEDAGTDFEP